MKAILFIYTFLFAVTAHSAHLPIDFSGYPDEAHPLAPGTAGCTANSCYATQSGVYSFNIDGYDQQPADDDEYFYLPTEWTEGGFPVYEAVFRGVAVGGGFDVYQDVDFTVSWTSFGLDNLRLLFDGIFSDISSNPSGTFEASMSAGDYFSAGVYGLAYTKDAFLSFEITIKPIAVSEVPLPASVFLLAPALLGFMGFRRKAKLS